MNDMTTQEDWNEIKKITGLATRSLQNNGLGKSKTRIQNAAALYELEKAQRETARVATAKAERAHNAAFNLTRGGGGG